MQEGVSRASAQKQKISHGLESLTYEATSTTDYAARYPRGAATSSLFTGCEGGGTSSAPKSALVTPGRQDPFFDGEGMTVARAR